jgi:hypothetical protein
MDGQTELWSGVIKPADIKPDWLASSTTTSIGRLKVAHRLLKGVYLAVPPLRPDPRPEHSPLVLGVFSPH